MKFQISALIFTALASATAWTSTCPFSEGEIVLVTAGVQTVAQVTTVDPSSQRVGVQNIARQADFSGIYPMTDVVGVVSVCDHSKIPCQGDYVKEKDTDRTFIVGYVFSNGVVSAQGCSQDPNCFSYLKDLVLPESCPAGSQVCNSAVVEVGNSKKPYWAVGYLEDGTAVLSSGSEIVAPIKDLIPLVEGPKLTQYIKDSSQPNKLLQRNGKFASGDSLVIDIASSSHEYDINKDPSWATGSWLTTSDTIVPRDQATPLEEVNCYKDLCKDQPIAIAPGYPIVFTMIDQYQLQWPNDETKWQAAHVYQVFSDGSLILHWDDDNKGTFYPFLFNYSDVQVIKTGAAEGVYLSKEHDKLYNGITWSFNTSKFITDCVPIKGLRIEDTSPFHYNSVPCQASDADLVPVVATFNQLTSGQKVRVNITESLPSSGSQCVTVDTIFADGAFTVNYFDKEAYYGGSDRGYTYHLLFNPSDLLGSCR